MADARTIERGGRAAMQDHPPGDILNAELRSEGQGADDMTMRFCGVLILAAGAGVFYVSGLLIATGDPARWLWTVSAVFGAAMAGLGVKLLAETRNRA